MSDLSENRPHIEEGPGHCPDVTLQIHRTGLIQAITYHLTFRLDVDVHD